MYDFRNICQVKFPTKYTLFSSTFIVCQNIITSLENSNLITSSLDYHEQILNKNSSDLVKKICLNSILF